MRRVKMIATACVTAAMVALGISATAQDLNPLEKTYLTFSGSVEMPGVVLQAGTYVFKLADTSGRNVVQVFSQDEKDMLGQWLFVQHERPDVTGDTVVTFRETREGATPAVQYWYYPGEKIGKEFIYPKEQATRIAARTGATVRTDDGEVTASSSTARAEAPAPAAEASAAAQPSAAAGSLAGNRAQAEARTDAQAGVVEGAGLPAEPRTETQAVGTSGRAAANAQAQPETQTAQAELPRTASPLALNGLLGLLSIAGAAGIRFFRS